MAKLIDVDSLRERVLYRKKPRNHMDDEAGAYDRGFNAGIAAAAKEIADAPTLSPDEVRGVVCGTWLDHQEGRWVYAKCSRCETVHDVKYNYCPSCGAKMEVRDNASP